MHEPVFKIKHTHVRVCRHLLAYVHECTPSVLFPPLTMPCRPHSSKPPAAHACALLLRANVCGADAMGAPSNPSSSSACAAASDPPCTPCLPLLPPPLPHAGAAACACPCLCTDSPVLLLCRDGGCACGGTRRMCRSSLRAAPKVRATASCADSLASSSRPLRFMLAAAASIRPMPASKQAWRAACAMCNGV